MVEELPEKSSKKLSPAEWEQIVAIYEHGTETMEGLAGRFGISLQAVYKGLKRRGIKKGSKSYVYGDAVNEALKDNASEKAKEVANFKKNMHTYGDYVMQLAVSELKKISDTPESAEKTKLMQSTLKNTADILKTIRDHKYHLYDLYKDNIEDDKIPEIGVAEYTQEEIELIQREQEKIRAVAKPVVDDEDEEDFILEEDDE